MQSPCDPQQADAWHLLGVVAHQNGQSEDAIEFIRRAIALNPNDASYLSNLGGVYRHTGMLSEAVVCYRRAVELVPDFADGLYNLGNTLIEVGQIDEAIACLSRTTALRPRDAEAFNNLGVALVMHGNIADGVAALEHAIHIKADYAEAYANLGRVHFDQGDMGAAFDSFYKAQRLDPQGSESYFYLGNIYRQTGQIDHAIRCYRQTIALRPQSPEALNNLGVALAHQSNFAEAIGCYRQALDLIPDYFDAIANLGATYRELGDVVTALSCFRQALQINPNSAEVHNNQGVALITLGRIEAAIDHYHRAIELKPEYAEAYSNLGAAFESLSRLDEAEAAVRKSIELKPDFAEAHNNRGNVSKARGLIDEGVLSFRRALELKPDFTDAHSNLLCALQYRPGVQLSDLAKEQARYERQHAIRFDNQSRRPSLPIEPNRILRVGFVSADFGNHPIGHLMLPILENWDRQQMQAICFSNRCVVDSLTAQLRALCDEWHDVHALPDAQLAELIRDQRIDILIDLSGHTAKNRLLTFARKPAPIQASWMGYVGPTGLSAIEYFIADKVLVSDELLGKYRERVIRLDTPCCYRLPGNAPEVGPLPAERRGSVTFGSFNNPAKITPQVVQTWARILLRLPTSRLLMKYRGIDSQSVTDRYRALFAAAGIDPTRVEFQGASPFADMLDLYNTHIDLALDPFPYNGGTTTILALYMGVPVVTCPGETVAARQSLAVLTALGTTETVARDLDEYVDLAVDLAGDLSRLARLRRELRPRCLASALFDGQRFTADLMNHLRQVWRQWVAEHPN